MQQTAVIWGVMAALVLGAVGVALWLFARQPRPGGQGLQEKLPTTVDGWQRVPGGQSYDPETIFSYIDGHAEVYLAYGMRGCVAERFSGPEGEPDLILDIFEMASPADAFGVFTHDTEGEAVGIGRDSRFRYGWLSFWQGPYFVSIVVEGETERSQRAALELGRRVAAFLPADGSEPPIVAALPLTDLGPGSVRYLHHPQILNTHLPVDPDNLLDLGMDTHAALGTYRKDEGQVYLLVVDYPTLEQAEAVEEELLEELSSRPETGFSGSRREQRRLAVVWEAPTGDWATELLSEVFESGR